MEGGAGLAEELGFGWCEVAEDLEVKFGGESEEACLHCN